MKHAPRERGFLQCCCETWRGYVTPIPVLFASTPGITVKKGNDIVPIAGLHETRQPRSSAHGRTKVILRPCAGSAGETGRSVSYMCASSCLLVPIPASYRSVAGHHCPCSRKCLGTGSHLRHHHSPEDGAAAETRRCSTHRLASRRRCLEMKSSP